MKTIVTNPQHQKIWNKIVLQHQIDSQQEQKFATFLQLLLQENEKYNITAITDVDSVLLDHFADSLALLKNYDMSSVKSLVDVGTGGGFPGIPLAIMLPDLQITLIEVNLKKVHFLNLAVQALELKNVTICSDDWRTFLRTHTNAIDLAVARASLQVDELLRMFKPSSKLQHATLIYWASKKWVPTEQEKEYLERCVEYGVGQKQRNLCFFKNK